MNKPLEEYIIRTEQYHYPGRSTYYLITKYGTLRISIQREPATTRTKLFTECLLLPHTPEPFIAEAIQYVRNLDSKLINAHA